MKKEMSRTQRRRQAKIRKMLLSLSMVLVLALAAVGGTIAWLTDETGTVTNTFTVGNIDIELEETGTDKDGNKSYKMVPGTELEKDPTVTVKAGSEAAYVFVKVVKSANYDSYISSEIDEAWTLLETSEDKLTSIYYLEQAALTADNAADVEYEVLKDSTVTVRDGVTKEMMDAITNGAAKPTIAFTAYAIQSDNLNPDTPANAWTLVNQ